MVRVIVIAAVLLTLGIAGVRETVNYLEYPCLERLDFPRLDRQLVLYHRGSRDRTATAFVAGSDPRDTPSPITRINYAEAGRIEDPPPFGELRWTADGGGVYATGRDDRGVASHVILWVYDLHTGTLLENGQIHEPSGNEVAQMHLERALAMKGGGGARACSWYEIGERSGYLYSWKSAHWDRLSRSQEQPPQEGGE